MICKPYSKIIYVFFLTIFLFACTSNKEPLPEPRWEYAPKGIKIHYRADVRLNFYDNVPHTLVLKIFQLRDASHFKTLARTEPGFIRLLQFTGQPAFLGETQADILSYKQLIVEPGEEKIVYLDRAEGARWVGIVAGYYRFNLFQACKIFEIPLIYKEEGLIFKEKSVSVGELFVNLILGPSGLQQAGG